MIIAGDAIECLRLMPDECAHCCVTSPPYYGLRDYGVAGQIGLEPSPESYVARMVEVFREVRRVLRSDGTFWLNIGDSYAGGHETGRRDTQQKRAIDGKAATSKPGEIKQLRRGNPGKNGGVSNRDGVGAVGSCKPKDLIGIPWMLAFALRADGWYLRRDIIWHKPNPMPESVTDRPTSAHEYLFMLTKSGAPTYWTHRDHEGSRTKPGPDYRWQQTDDNGRVIAEQDFEPPGFRKNWPHWKRINLWDGHDYFYDAEAIKESCSSNSHGSPNVNPGIKQRALGQCSGASTLGRWTIDDKTRGLRNKRSVWTVTTKAYKGAHFATFPPDLIEPCILAGTSERGVCPKCGAPWARVIERDGEWRAKHKRQAIDGSPYRVNPGGGIAGANTSRTWRELGWRASCDHPAHNPVPSTVLDPFFGAGTTGLVADRLGRDCIGIELNPAYALMAHRRIEAARPIKEAA